MAQDSSQQTVEVAGAPFLPFLVTVVTKISETKFSIHSRFFLARSKEEAHGAGLKVLGAISPVLTSKVEPIPDEVLKQLASNLQDRTP